MYLLLLFHLVFKSFLLHQESSDFNHVSIFSLGITILELACFIELPTGGELWQELRDGKLPTEFTRGMDVIPCSSP